MRTPMHGNYPNPGDKVLASNAAAHMEFEAEVKSVSLDAVPYNEDGYVTVESSEANLVAQLGRGSWVFYLIEE